MGRAAITLLEGKPPPTPPFAKSARAISVKPRFGGNHVPPTPPFGPYLLLNVRRNRFEVGVIVARPIEL
jgi:hypothetical protein